jgi:hypothetical protein
MTTKLPDAYAMEDAVRAIRSLGELLGCRDSMSEDKALEAFRAGRAAYWRNVGYHNQAVGNLCDAANDIGLGAALDARPTGHTAPQASPLFLIASLVPLNPLARAELHAARDAIINRRNSPHGHRAA